VWPVFQLGEAQLDVSAFLAPDAMRSAGTRRYEADCEHCGAHLVWTDRLGQEALSRGENAIWV
jgi:hypothetical protein